MIRLIPLLVLAVGACWLALSVEAQERIEEENIPPPPPAPFLRTDVDGSGAVTLSDVLAVFDQVGQRSSPNPCVPYTVFDENNQPDFEIINSLGVRIESPSGGMYLLTWAHPSYEAYAAGLPTPLWPCP
jgi:hypothetical protein